MNMNPSICKSLIVAAAFIFIINFSCRKEEPARNGPIPAYILYANKPPVARAGPDIVIGPSPCASLHLTSLDGSGSYDPDNNIRTFHWKKIDGPADGQLTNNGDDTAIYRDIGIGRYSFELTVTDYGGLVSKDTVVVDATGWRLPAYALNVSLNGSYRFDDNFQDCSDFPDCTYIDWFSLTCTGVDPQLGEFNLYTNEVADTSGASGIHYTNMGLTARDGFAPYNRQIAGPATVFFKQVIRNGGGNFSGLFNANSGTAESCDRNIYSNTGPLTITGHMDTSSKQINIRITGTTYF